MRFALGFAAGLATAWAALAIWQRIPPLGPIDQSDLDLALTYEEAVAMRGRGVDVMSIAERGIPVPRPWS